VVKETDSVVISDDSGEMIHSKCLYTNYMCIQCTDKLKLCN